MRIGLSLGLMPSGSGKVKPGVLGGRISGLSSLSSAIGISGAIAGLSTLTGAIGGSAPPVTVTALTAVTRAGNAWTFTFSRTGSTSGSRSDGWAVIGSSLNGLAALAADFGGSFPSGTMTFAPGSATTTVTVTPTDFAEPN